MKCRDCGESIQFLDGDKRPYDLTPRIHYANKIHIAAVRKNGAPTRRQSRKSGDSPAPYAAKLLRDMNYTKAEAADMLKDIPEGAPEDMVLAALTKMGADL
jgi:hypothetical protein